MDTKRLLNGIQTSLEQRADAEYRTRAAEYSKKEVDGCLATRRQGRYRRARRGGLRGVSGRAGTLRTMNVQAKPEPLPR